MNIYLWRSGWGCYAILSIKKMFMVLTNKLDCITVIIQEDIKTRTETGEVAMKYQKLNKKALQCMYVAEIISIVIISAVLFGIYYWLKKDILADRENLQWILTALLVLIPVQAVCSLLVPPIRYARYRYILTEEELEVREGIIVITREIVPIERIHKIEVNAGPIDRVFGLAKVKAVTAGGEVTARFLENEKAEQIAEALKKRINRIVAEDRESQDGRE